VIEVPKPIAERVARSIAALDRPLPDGAAGALGGFIALVASWNARIDLTAARHEDELVDLMLADALVLAARLPEGARVVDVGTGAGAPGLPLAIARPDLALTLVEPLQKRVAFLRTAVGTLFAPGAMPRVARGRGEEIAAKGEAFAVAISRATLPPPAWLELGTKLVRDAGDVWVLLAKEPPPERAGWNIEDDVRYRWPLTGAERRAVRYRPASGG
jgi:16S rRNA (guanine527-N7)-methyltransferase